MTLAALPLAAAPRAASESFAGSALTASPGTLSALLSGLSSVARAAHHEGVVFLSPFPSPRDEVAGWQTLARRTCGFAGVPGTGTAFRGVWRGSPDLAVRSPGQVRGARSLGELRSDVEPHLLPGASGPKCWAPALSRPLSLPLFSFITFSSLFLSCKMRGKTKFAL